jgi:hypothetical protein
MSKQEANKMSCEMKAKSQVSMSLYRILDEDEYKNYPLVILHDLSIAAVDIL